MNLLRFDVLDGGRFAGLLIDGVDDDAVLAPLVDLLPVELHHILRAVCAATKRPFGCTCTVLAACRERMLLGSSSVVLLNTTSGSGLPSCMRCMWIWFCVSIDTYIHGFVG